MNIIMYIKRKDYCEGNWFFGYNNNNNNGWRKLFIFKLNIVLKNNENKKKLFSCLHFLKYFQKWSIKHVFRIFWIQKIENEIWK